MGKGDLVPRIITDFGVRLGQSQHAHLLTASPVNLSETGLCVRMAHVLTPDTMLNLEIDLDDNAHPMKCLGRMVWKRQDEHNHIYYYGIGFLDLDENARKRIQDYVQLGSQSLMRFLSEFPLFKEFTVDDCKELLKIITLRRLDKKEILYQQGAEDWDLQGLFVVQSGLLSIYDGKELKPQRQLAVVSPGQVFGEITLIKDQPHSATIVAVNPSILIQINKVGFRLIRKQNPQLALKLMDIVAHTLSARLGRTTKKLFSPINF